MSSLNDSFKVKAFAQLVKSDIWEKHLKPELIAIKEEAMRAESELDTEFECVKRDIKRANTIRIINRIIISVENAAEKANKLMRNKND